LAGSGVPFAVPALGFAITGPGVIHDGQSATYSAAFATAFGGNVTLSDGGAGGVFSPPALAFSGQTSMTFDYTPAGKAHRVLTATPSSGSGAASRSVAVTAESVKITGPALGVAGRAATYVATPDGPWSGTLTLSDGLTGTQRGVFNPATLV